MAKEKTVYVCSNCGQESSKWIGKCPSCGEWNTFKEFKVRPETAANAAGRHSFHKAFETVPQRIRPVAVSDIKSEEVPRIDMHDAEFNRVLGGGLVPGSLVLLGGEPGIGKSTLLLQTVLKLTNHRILYVSGEESAAQLKLRADRLIRKMKPAGTSEEALWKDSQCMVVCETSLEEIFVHIKNVEPELVIIDSIQTMMTETVDSSPGSISQVRECAAELVRLCKPKGIITFVLGHVTKDGTLAGPKILEHCVDCSIFLSSSADPRFRTLRCQKNRFGAVNEIGVFAMTDKGLREVSNPSAIFLNRQQVTAPGSVAMVLWEGSRPLLVEVQALADASLYGNPRRLTVGTDPSRLAMLLSVLHRHAGMQFADQDVFTNVVGGIKVEETAADVPLCLALLSSLKERPIARQTIAFGEIGLTGEVRPVTSGQERIAEAFKQGFTRFIIPRENAPRRVEPGMEIHAVSRVSDLSSLI